MSWATRFQVNDLDIGITSNLLPWRATEDTPLCVVEEAAGFFLRDEATVKAIRERDPRIFEALECILDRIDAIAVAFDFDEHGGYAWEGLPLEEQERRYQAVVSSPYADRKACDAAQRGLAHVRNLQQKAAERRAKQQATVRRRADFGRKRDRLMLALIERDGYCCAECGTVENVTIDHIIPLSRGGSDDLDNLRLLCQPCNSRKGDRAPDGTV